MKPKENLLIGDRVLAPSSQEEEGAEYGKCLLFLIDACVKYFGESLALRKVSFYVKITHPWLEFGHSLVGLCDKAKNSEQLKQYILDFFSVPQKMYAKTDLRQ